MNTIIENFGLDKKGYTQANVEFLNVKLDRDNFVFVDYNKVLKFRSKYTTEMKTNLDAYLSTLFSQLKFKKRQEALNLLKGLHECNATKLGYSKKKPRGNSVGNVLKELIYQNAQYVIDALSTGQFTYNAFYFGVDQVGPDRISDIVISIIKESLIKFTQEQCNKHSIPMKKMLVKNVYDLSSSTWKNKSFELPIYDAQSIIFLPKRIISSDGNLISTFDRFLRYGFRNFVKDNQEYAFLLSGENKSVRKKDYDKYIVDNGVKIKDETKKWITKNNTAIIDFQSENDPNIIELADVELEDLIKNPRNE